MVNGPNHITIDLSALVHNLAQVTKLVDKRAGIMGIVKADAYGHGLVPISQTLERNKIDCLGVGYLPEALELKRNNIRVPIVILGGIFTRDEAREVVEGGFITVLYDMKTAQVLAEEAVKLDREATVLLKVDTGMGRLGIPHKETGDFLKGILALKGLCVSGLISHFSSADRYEDDFTDTQIKYFKEAVEVGRSLGLHLHFNSLANSAGIIAHGDACFDVVRPGITLYGGLPSPGFQSPVPLRPVMHFKGRVLQIRDLPDGTPVSYGRTYYTIGPRRIAILSAGYAEGLPRSMSNAGNVLIRGKKAPIVGMVCMNFTLVDITGIQGVDPGDEAVFLGSQMGQRITGDDMARSAGTISYEIFCSLGLRNKKEYLS